MSLDRARIDALFEAALEREPCERDAWLDATTDDVTLRAAVARLLRAHERADGILEQPVPGNVAELAAALAARKRPEPEPAMADVGRRIGPYRLVREIGRGGMGTVYLAERADEQFDQRVAVKLIHAGHGTDELHQRFLAERQILASLQHPGIARLLDGGMAQDGRPYLVMEYVDGRPIDRFCDERRLSVDDRLRLFARVARAVHYAHSNLVVHRDLKPSNILITNEGGIRLLDFGIAKMLDADAAQGTTPVTRTGHRPMTPEYASPEQVRGEAVTTAADVYSLGVVLYELLTGRRPFRAAGRSVAEVERLIVEGGAPKPSVAVRRIQAMPATPGSPVITPVAVASARATDAERLRRKLAGDLDRVVGTAMHRECDRRYRSAEQLAEDVDRYLGGRPIVARGDAAAYRVRKFATRHRWGVVAGVAFIVMLAGYATMLTVKGREVRLALADARAESERSEQTTALLMQLFDGAHDDDASAAAAASLLEGGVARAERLEKRPLAQAGMLEAIGRLYEYLGEYDRAQPLIERSLSIRRARLGPNHPSVGESLYDLGGVLFHQADVIAAESMFRQALEVQRATLGPEDRAIARTLNALSIAVRSRGHLDEAEPLAREALAMSRRLLPPDHPEVAQLMNNLGSILSELGDLAAADTLANHALRIVRGRFPAPDGRVASALFSLAEVKSAEGDLVAADSLYSASLAMLRELSSSEGFDIATTLYRLALVTEARADTASAEVYLREAFDIRSRLLGNAHPTSRETANRLLAMYGARGKTAAAADLRKRIAPSRNATR